jgi:predicted phage terminase large subunit-like protein|tara:strand:+ start:1077 stop:2330 length:1254 start_codon:yes stop_codon:yes gene_type:complete
VADLQVNLHPAQLEIFRSDARFKVVAAGRRFGKSRLAGWLLLISALKSKDKDVFYVAPTFQQAKDIMWGMLKELGKDVIAAAHENTAVLTLINGRKIYLKGSDRPDTLRGVGLSYLVLDEYASMKPAVWEQILRPTLADVKGSALFIGTPAGKNHFYDLYIASMEEDDWEHFSYTSLDNPMLDPNEIENARKNMSSQSFRQEFEASFESFTGGIFKEEWILYEDKPRGEGSYYMAVDPAGFEDVASSTGIKNSRLDETAIALVHVSPEGWFVDEIKHGRWGIRETSLQILRLAQKHQVMAVGIEKGSLKNALIPYLEDQMRRMGVYPNIIEVTHGGKKKTDRITWSLQGRFEHGRILLKKNEKWNKPLVDQLLDFPNPLSHDDLPDALSYIDQVATTDYAQAFQVDDWEPIDAIAGY